MSINLDPLRSIVGDLEKAVEDVASKVVGAVEADVSQSAVDELVSRVGAQVERLTGLQAPATQTSGTAAADQSSASSVASSAPAGGSVPAWTPDKPAA